MHGPTGENGMKRFAAYFAFMCVLLPLPTIANNQPSVENQELMAEAAAFMPWTGDLDGMVERRIIRVLVAPSRTSYWLL